MKLSLKTRLILLWRKAALLPLRLLGWDLYFAEAQRNIEGLQKDTAALAQFLALERYSLLQLEARLGLVRVPIETRTDGREPRYALAASKKEAALIRQKVAR